MTELATCMVCGAHLGDTGADWVSCMRCGLRTRTTQQSDQVLEERYAEVLRRAGEKPSGRGTGRELAVQYLTLLEAAIKGTLDSRHTALDFGAGEGALSQLVAVTTGAEVIAVEPRLSAGASSDDRVSWLGDTTGVGSDRVDVVFCVEVLEHLPMPFDELWELHRCMKAGATLFITTPNARSLRSLMHGDSWREAQKADHLHLYSATALRRLLHQCGFVQVKRCRGLIRLPLQGPKRVVQLALQLLRLDGQLRYVARKPATR